MLPHPDIGDTDLYRQLFSFLQQLEDPVRPRTPGAEAKPDLGDATIYRNLFTYSLQKNKMILIQETFSLQTAPHISGVEQAEIT